MFSTGNVSLIHGKATFPDKKVHGANMGPIWGRQVLSAPDGPHVGPINFAIWDNVRAYPSSPSSK